MFAAPKLSAPLTKAIRTSEGILVWLVNVGLAAGAILEPAKLPAKEAAIVGGALTGLHVASRTLLKITALQRGVGIEAPQEIDLLPDLADHLAARLKLPEPVVTDETVARIVSEAVKAIGDPKATLQALVSDAEEFAHEPPAPQGPPAVAPAAPVAPAPPPAAAPAPPAPVVA